MDKLRFSMSYLWLHVQEVMTFGFYQPVFKKVRAFNLLYPFQYDTPLNYVPKYVGQKNGDLKMLMAISSLNLKVISFYTIMETFKRKFKVIMVHL